MGPRSDLDRLENEKLPSPRQESVYPWSSSGPVTVLTELPWIISCIEILFQLQTV